MRRAWDGALSSGDVAEAARALAEIEEELRGDDPGRRRVALALLAAPGRRAESTRFFRALLLELLTDPDGGIRVRAGALLRGTDDARTAVETVVRQIPEDAVEERVAAARVLAAITGGDLSGDSEDGAVASLLDDRDPVVRSQTLAVLTEATAVGTATVRRLSAILATPELDDSLAESIGRIAARSDPLATTVVGLLSGASDDRALVLLRALHGGVPARSRAHAFDEVRRMIDPGRSAQLRRASVFVLAAIDRPRAEEVLPALRGSGASDVDRVIDRVLGAK